MRNCAILSNLPSGSLDLGLLFLPTSPSVSKLFLLAFPKMARWLPPVSERSRIFERLRGVLGSFELQLHDLSSGCLRSCSHSKVLLHLLLCVGTWDRSTCPAWSRCGPIFSCLVWFGFRNEDFRDRLGPRPIFR